MKLHSEMSGRYTYATVQEKTSDLTFCVRETKWESIM